MLVQGALDDGGGLERAGLRRRRQLGDLEVVFLERAQRRMEFTAEEAAAVAALLLRLRRLKARLRPCDGSSQLRRG